MSFTVSSGGLLWVNGTSIVNASTVSYENNTLLLLTATPTNANYSYTSINLNGTVTTDNPAFYNLTTNDEGISNQTISVVFTAEAIPTPTPTPDPNAITAEDSLAVAVVFGVLAIAVCVGVVYSKK